MPFYSKLTARYFIGRPPFSTSVAIVLASKGQPFLALHDRRGRPVRVDHYSAGQSWPDVADWAGIDKALVRDGRCILVFSTLRDARRCWLRLLDCGIRT